MKRILQLVVTRWLARTPLGLVVLGLGWLFMRKRKSGRQQPERNRPPREPGRRGSSAWSGRKTGVHR